MANVRDRWNVWSAVGVAMLALWAGIAPATAEPCERPTIVSREGWKAKPANPALMKKQTISAIVIHNTGARTSRKLTTEEKVRNLQSFSQKPGKVGNRRKPAWGDVPYHFYIGVDGKIVEGRSLEYAGDSNTVYQTTSKVQVVVEGDFTFEEPTDAQMWSLKRVVCWLRQDYKIDGALIYGHSQLASTTCPGKNLLKHLGELR